MIKFDILKDLQQLAHEKRYTDLGNCLQEQAGAVGLKGGCIEWRPPLGSGTRHSTLAPATP